MHALLPSVPPTLQQATTNPRLCWRLLDIHRQVWVSLLWGHCSFPLGPGAQGSVSQSCVKFWQLYGGVNGDLLQGGLCHTQVCCTQSPCLCGSPLLTLPPQETLKHNSVSISVGSLGPGVHKVWALLVSLAGMGFDSKYKFTSPNVLLGFLWPWTWGFSSRPLATPIPCSHCCTTALNMPANLETQQCPQDLKRSVFIPVPKKGKAKECSNCCTIALISHASKVILKILQARLQQYMNQELPDVQAEFRKGTGIREPIANIHWIIEKAREFQKNIYLCFIDYTKAFDCGSQQTGKFFKRWEYQTTLPTSCETCIQIKK